jgi:cytochrome c biogenesis protein CcdA/thiol-disulfide isomerase/thioredoxin
MTLLILFAFLSGIATILSPCIWPILPIVLSSSAQGGKLRPFGVTLGICVSFAIFTLSISYLVKIFDFDPNTLRLAAVIIIGFLGFAMLIPKLNQYLEILISKLSSKFGTSVQNTGNGFTPGFITGFSLGAVWSPCAGPILASVAALAATSQIGFSAIIITIAYVAGIGIPLFLLGYGGQQLITKSRSLSKYTGRIQQIFGVIMILTAVAIYFNYDQTIQLKILEKFPQLDASTTFVENNEEIKDQLNNLSGTKGLDSSKTSDLKNYGPAPEFEKVTKWLNTQNNSPLTMQELKGKVVLVDFWTYTCINCIRTLPHVTSWYEKYKDQNFVVVGIHTPEFEFEKNTANVQKALEKYKINYPVAQDNDYGTWYAYQNQFWPAKYLIDANGNIRYVHFGEGDYDVTEEAIRALIEENGATVAQNLDKMDDTTPQNQLTPETYLGSARMQYFYPDGKVSTGVADFNTASKIPLNTFSYGGKWDIQDEYAKAVQNATLDLRFKANKVFLVLKPSDGVPKKVRVLIDGKEMPIEALGEDVKDGSVTVDTDRLYSLANISGPLAEHTIRLEFEDGIEAYAFTFGD